jgi:hypothetical protein
MTEEKAHPNSKKITIFRAGSFLVRAQGEGIADYYQSSNVSIGSFWEGPNNQKAGSGLSYEEKELLLPHLINAEKDDRDFKRMVEEYFHDMSTKVPYGTGVTLEIGLKEDNNKKVSANNMPLNIAEYVKYRHHVNHPDMAQNKAEAESDPRKQYYIFDPTENQRRRVEKNKEKDAAMQIYLKLANETEKIDMMLVMFEIDPREFEIGEDRELIQETKLDKLRELSEQRPKDFTDNYTQQDLEIKAWLRKMVTAKVLLKIGSAYRNAKDQRILGHNEAEAIAWFEDEQNEQEVALLKSSYQEASRKPVVAGPKRTILTTKQLGGK